MNLEKMLPRPWRRSRWFWPVVAAIVILVLVIVAVPLALVLPGKKTKGSQSSVILPLYIYPQNNSSWSPIYEALKLRPDLQFTVIVNPNSGPGRGPTPDEGYINAISRLSSFANVQMLGYVRTGYATRKRSDVLGEVDTYADWSSNSSSLAMHGIFLDEAPHQYEAEAVDFMREVGDAIKRSTGLRDPKTIVHNPGTIPDYRFADLHADITVVFEHDFNTWEDRQSTMEALPDDRSTYSLMIHSTPLMDQGRLKDFVTSLSHVAKHLFVTSNNEDFYASFGSDWLDFVGQVPA